MSENQVVSMPGVMGAVFADMNNQIDVYILQRAANIFNRMDNAVDDRYYPPVMSRDQCKHYLHIDSDSKLNQLRKKGLKSHKDGRSVWYVRAEVDKFIMLLPEGK